MAKFSYSTEENDTQIQIHLVGVMDADMHITPLKEGDTRTVILDFDLISGINSTGIRNWATFLTDSQIEAKNVVFRKCRPAIVDQINISHMFMPEGALVESFYLDYVCENCEHEKEILHSADHFDTKKIPAETCEKCLATMEFDGDEEFDFLFLEKLKK